MSMNLLTLVHQNVPDRCSSRHVLNQNVVTQGSCLGVLLSGWDEDLGLGVRAVFTWVGVALLSGKEKKKKMPTRWHHKRLESRITDGLTAGKTSV